MKRMNFRKLNIPVAILLLMGGMMVLNACKGGKEVQQTAPSPDNGYSYMSRQQHLVQATVWQQRSGEYRALCWQAYNTAKLRLDLILANRAGNQKPAVVVDVDETVLDNSPYTVYNIMSGNPYAKNDWMAWTKLAIADTVPGALGFLKYAASKGADVYYITNRYADETAWTVANLQKHGFPMADMDHVMTRTDVSSKEARREKVMADHEIVMLAGDALTDFSTAFEGTNLEDLQANTDKYKSEFGNRFIVLPNPLYGGWEGAVMKGMKSPTEEQRDSLRKASLHGFEK